VDWIHLALCRVKCHALFNVNKHSDSIKGREFLDQLSNIQLIKCSAP
jgi:hypothetical protein